MDLSKTQLIESVFAGGGEMGARMRAVDWSTTVLGPVEQWPQSLRACVRIVLGSGIPMLISWGPDYTMLYNDAYGVVVGTKHPGALGRSCREVLAEAWDFIGPLFDTVFTEGQPISTLTDQLFTFHRNNYLEECYFAFSYSPIPDDNGRVGGVLTNALDMTERVIEDRRRQVLRDLASRTAEARNEEEVWRVSAETLGENRSSAPFAFLYEYRPGEQKAVPRQRQRRTPTRVASVSHRLHSESLWRFHKRTGRRIASSSTLAARIGAVHPRLAVAAARSGSSANPVARAAARRQGSWCWESIRAARSTTPTANSSAGSPNKSPSGWPARARTSRSASARRRWPRSIAPRPRSSATSATSSARRSH